MKCGAVKVVVALAVHSLLGGPSLVAAQCLASGAACVPGQYNGCNAAYAPGSTPECFTCESGTFCLTCPLEAYCEDGDTYGTCANVGCPDGQTLRVELGQSSCDCVDPPTATPPATTSPAPTPTGSETPSPSGSSSTSPSSSSSPSASLTTNWTPEATSTSTPTRSPNPTVSSSCTGSKPPSATRTPGGTPSQTRTARASGMPADGTPTPSTTRTCNAPAGSCAPDPETAVRPKDQNRWSGGDGSQFDSALQDYSRDGGRLFFYVRGYKEKKGTA